MDRYFWRHQSEFVDLKEKKPQALKWKCPSCIHGKLILDKRNFSLEETEASRIEGTKGERLPEMVEYIFSGLLKCRNCNTQVAVVGSGYLEQEVHYIEQTGDAIDITGVRLNPKYFHPPLNLITVPANCPEKIKSEIYKSFSLYWTDVESCANKIRNVIELMMDYFGVKKWYKPEGKKKEEQYKLHQRIEKFKTKNEKVAQHLMAIKIITNEGSHAGGIKIDDVLDSFELLELAIEGLFIKKQDRLEKLAKTIVKRNKPMSK